MSQSMQFDAISENRPGDKWLGRWNRSWPAYRQWFVQRGGASGPSKTECAAALEQYMPELVPVWKSLSYLSGGDDLAARFLSTWCPPAYLGGCSLAALSENGKTRLVRNYDLSPDLNEGLLLRSEWTGTPVMGMVEFLWGLSDGINEHGLAVALAFGGSRQVGIGFGITTILRYVLETCHTVEQALDVLDRVPSHMAYNIVVADANARSVAVELKPGGGIKVMETPISTNHQHDCRAPDRAAFTQTFERLNHLEHLTDSDVKPEDLGDEFMKAPLFQRQYSESMGTLFTADYDTAERSLRLRWQALQWLQSLDEFEERTQYIVFDQAHGSSSRPEACKPQITEGFHWLDQLQTVEQYAANKDTFNVWMLQARAGNVNWASFSDAFSHN